MKKVLFYKLGLLILLVNLSSCKADAIYFRLTDEVKSFLFFEVNDTFKLKNVETDAVITYSVTKKEYSFYEDPENLESSFIAFPTFGKKDKVFLEEGIYTFTDGGTCNNGEFRAYAKKEGGFAIFIYFKACFGIYDSFELVNNSTQTVIINGVSYFNVSVFRGYTGILYYSKTHGIVQIVNPNQAVLFEIVP